MKILLMTPPWYRLQGASLSHYPPGPAYIAGALERIGYDSIVYNADYDSHVKSVVGGTNILNTDELTKQYNRYIKNLNDESAPIWNEIERMIRYFNPDVLGVSVYTATFKSAVNVVKIAKKINKSVTTIFGGVHPTIDPITTLNEQWVDFVVMGEGELTAQELIKTLDSNNKDFSKIKGIAYKENGKIRVNPKRELVADLDDIVYPARHKLFQSKLCPPAVFHMVYTSRGCPYHCIFCGSHNIWERVKRSRSAESILDEIERTQKDYKTRYFYICDDIFFYQKDIPRAYEFMEGLLKRKLKILWSTQTRAETINDSVLELLKLMKKTGGQHISIGVETGSDRISQLIKKGNRIEHVKKASKLIHQSGLYMSAFFMVGFPWEREEEIKMSLDFLAELKPAVAFPYIVTPAPGTELHKIALDMGLIHSTVDLEKYYHESPEMGLSANIHKDNRTKILNNVLKTFSQHNKKQFRALFLKRLWFYVALMKDYSVFKNPRVLVGYIGDICKGIRKTKNISMSGKNVIITGASSGIGRSCAYEFIKNGANVLLVSRTEEKLERLKKELQTVKPDARVDYVVADVSDENAVNKMISYAHEIFGTINILVNNAGIGHFGKIADTSTSSFEKIINTNVAGVFYTTRAVIPFMKKQGGGCIVNIGSVVAHKAFPNMGVYSASKYAVKGLTEALRFELERSNILVMLVNPGQTETLFAKNAIYDSQEKNQPTRKGMKSDVVAKTIVKGLIAKKVEINLSLEGKVITMLNRISPRFLDFLIKTTRSK